MIKWVKKGLLFVPGGQFDWVATHAMLPTAELIQGDLYRIYFSGRDKLNRSRIGYIEVDINKPENILCLTERPVLGLGQLGCFDDNGVSPTWIVNNEGIEYLYYLGWNKGSTVRASEVTGLAVSKDGGATFERVSKAPILDRTNEEPYTVLVVSCILIENGIWRMWYDSADEWINKDLPRYNIKYAESKDGVTWERKGIVCIDFEYPDETRISRACVLKEEIYRMWYCYALGDGGYRIGYAESADGIHWQRKDKEAGIDVSEYGWDSEMVCYPFVFRHKGKRYMLYCGNGYGRTGFGIAVAEE